MKIEQANKLINKHENEDIPKINEKLTDAKEKADDWSNFKVNGGEIGGSLGVKGFRVSSNIEGKEYSQYYNSSLNSLIGLINGDEQYQQSETEFSPVYSGTPKTLGSLEVQWKDIYLSGFSKATNGYTKLPNGLIMQWGTITDHIDGVIYLPIAFPHVMLSLNGNIINTPDNWGGNLYLQYVNAGAFRAVVVNTPGKTYDINWIAVGY